MCRRELAQLIVLVSLQRVWPQLQLLQRREISLQPTLQDYSQKPLRERSERRLRRWRWSATWANLLINRSLVLTRNTQPRHFLKAAGANHHPFQRRKLLQRKHAEPTEAREVHENRCQTRTVGDGEHAASRSRGGVVLASHPERLQQREVFQREAFQLVKHVLRDEDASQRRKAAELQRSDVQVAALDPQLRHVSRRRLQLVRLGDVETRRSDDGSEVVTGEGNVVTEVARVYGEEKQSGDSPALARWFSRRHCRAV